MIGGVDSAAPREQPLKKKKKKSNVRASSNKGRQVKGRING